jgi:hypothetical protein
MWLLNVYLVFWTTTLTINPVPATVHIDLNRNRPQSDDVPSKAKSFMKREESDGPTTWQLTGTTPPPLHEERNRSNGLKPVLQKVLNQKGTNHKKSGRLYDSPSG